MTFGTTDATDWVLKFHRLSQEKKAAEEKGDEGLVFHVKGKMRRFLDRRPEPHFCEA